MKRMAETLTTVVALSLAASCGRVTESDDRGSADAGGTAGDAGPGSSDASGPDSSDASSPNGDADPPSCAVNGAGTSICGASMDNCCTSLEVQGGTYYRTYDLEPDGGLELPVDGGPIGEADPATVSTFRMDKYDVTVGRFRQFVAAWNSGSGYLPAAGSGKHTHLNAGNGLANVGTAGGYEPGWISTDSQSIAPTDANLACFAPYATWTSTASTQENLPINCVNWYESYAFCIWDGGFLPSEAEWEYAAAGGGGPNGQRNYPWGAIDPGSSNQYAIYGDNYAGTSSGIAPVGTANMGGGLWGQLDLAGNVFQWNLDWFATYVDPCTDCSNLSPALANRVFRGGDFLYTPMYLPPPGRFVTVPTDRFSGTGFRCARAP
jgi:sulfatase modifying factor 1